MIRDTEGRPIIRQIKITASTSLVLGKPMLIGSMDDPNSKRQFQLEVDGHKTEVCADKSAVQQSAAPGSRPAFRL